MNKNLAEAKAKKNDEFYTIGDSIFNEMVHYKEHFKGKTILMPADDFNLMEGVEGLNEGQQVSQFIFYFHKQFKFLGLKKIIATSYRPDGHGTKIEYDGNGDDDNVNDVVRTQLEGDGDFRSEEVRKLFEESDIIITNPPFSIIRKFIDQIMEFNKKFLIVAPDGIRTYKDSFRHIKEGKLWTGFTRIKEFITIDENKKIIVKKFGNIGWATNLEHNKRTEKIVMAYSMSDNHHQRVESYDAINIDKVNWIPKDYYGNIALPYSYLDKHNPSQFEIVGLDGTKEFPHTIVGGKTKYRRFIIRRRKDE